MIVDGKNDSRPLPATWLARARLQSQALADDRAGRARPFRREVVRRAVGGSMVARRPMMLALAGALAFLLLASGAWAVVVHVKRAPVPPPEAAPSATMITATPRAHSAVSSPSLPPQAQPLASKPSAPIARSKSKKPPPPAPPPPAPPVEEPTHASTSASREQVTFGEAEGELILVAPHEKQPPLFSPEEWKRRRSQGR